MSEKTHWKKFFNYDYLGAYSIEDSKDLIVTIKEVKKEKVKGQGGKEEECLVCYFTDSDKPMILNRTNCGIIEKVYNTPNVEDWPGKKIQLYSETVKAFGELTDALRIRDFVPKVQKPVLSKSMKAWSRATELISKGGSIERITDKYTVPADLLKELKSLKK